MSRLLPRLIIGGRTSLIVLASIVGIIGMGAVALQALHANLMNDRREKVQ